jgi:phytoene dehydrogenase-like protein
MQNTDWDAVVVGSGPNGLAAAILLREQGLSVLLIEAKKTIGGGLRTAEITLPGFRHDICSAIHPMALASPFFKTLPLADHGLRFIYPALAAAHPFDDGTAAFLSRSEEETADGLGVDSKAYHNLIGPLVQDWPLIINNLLGPLSLSPHPVALARFGLKALTSASFLQNSFKGKMAKGLFGGMAAHAIQPLENLATSAIAMVLMAAGHREDWPIPLGGSQSIASALESYYLSIGGKVETNAPVRTLSQIPNSKVVLFDIGPKQLMKIAGEKFSPLYRWQLNRYKYGMGAFKIDWALDAPIPFIAEACRKAGTVHIGNNFEEISLSERQSAAGRIAEKPFVLLAQQSLYDPSRAPLGKHTAWAYCHVPNGSREDMTARIEAQIERFAPGFREVILARSTMDTVQMEDYNPNYVGGDINGGVLDITQLFTRPSLRFSPYTTSAAGIYLCSSSTPPGGGVHGMCGFHAARRALRDVFKIRVPLPGNI